MQTAASGETPLSAPSAPRRWIETHYRFGVLVKSRFPVSSSNRQPGWLARLAPWALILAVVAFQAVNNWIWLSRNTVIPGWDRPAHLARSLAYYAALTPLTWQGLFKASVLDPIRPPLFPASATPLYWLFGLSDDVATMVNIIYWLILLASVYGLGAHLGGWRLGIWGVLLTALTPLLYGMSRSFYFEFALAAVVALSLYLLVASRGFERRRASLGFGLTLGLGFLTTRTYPVFVALPVAIAILRSGAIRSLWQRLRGGVRLSLPDLLLALGGGIALAALWYLPNRAQAQDLILGIWLFPAWTVLIAATIYLLLRRPKDPGVNCLSALSLAATVASLWTLPRIEFVRRVLLYGYGVGDTRGRKLDLTSIYTYTYYPRITVNEGLGLVLAALLTMLAVAAIVWLVKKRPPWRTLWQADTGWWVLFLWPVGAYLFLTLSIYKEGRAFTPALPPLALLLAAGLVCLPWRRLGRVLLGLAVAWGLVQFFVVSYSEVNGPARQTQFWSPLLGRAGLFARGDHIELPDAGATDPGYSIQPDVLARIDARRQVMGRDSVRLGVLAHIPQINAGSFLYSILTRYQAIAVTDLAPNYEGGDPLPRLYGYEYLLLTRINQDEDEQTQATIERLLDDPPPLFAEAFVLEATYPLPNGDTASLYRLRYWPDPDLPEAYLSEFSRFLADVARPGDALILAPPGLLAAVSRQGSSRAEIYLLPDPTEVSSRLASISRNHRRLFVLLGENEGTIESWLNRNAYRAQDRWFGNLRLALYGTTALPPPDQPTVMSGAHWGDCIELTGSDLPDQEFRPGDVVPLTLFWRAYQPVADNFKVFVHLLNTEGQLVAQRDSEPVGGQRPTATWQVGDSVVDRYGVLLPEGLAAGRYRLIVGLYVPSSGDRLLVMAGPAASLSDHLLVGTVVVVR